MRDRSFENQASLLVDALTQVRKQKDISHEKLAKMTNLHRSTISLIESKKRNPTLISCLKIAKALNVKLSDLLADIER